MMERARRSRGYFLMLTTASVLLAGSSMAAAQDLTGMDGFAAAMSTGASLKQPAALPPPKQQFAGAAIQMSTAPGTASRQAVLTGSPATALLASQQQQQQQQQQLQLLASSSLGQSATTLPGQQAFTSSQIMPSMTPSQQRAPAFQEMSGAAAPTAVPSAGPSLQQVLMKAALLGSGTSLESRSSAQVQAPKTATQEAMQDQVKGAALQRDTMKASELATEMSTSKPVVLLIHGGAQGGWVWSYPHEDAPAGVQGLLEDAGCLVYAPTLPYHEPDTQWSPTQGQLKIQDYVDYLKTFMEKEAITNAVVVGHSVSGVWLQLLSVQAAERISRIVFLDAIVLKNGESFISNSIGPAQLFFTMVFTYPAFPQSLSLPTGQIDLEVWKNVMITLEGNKNATFATDTYNRLVPEPAGPQLEYPDFTAFYEQPMPKFFLFEEDDVSLLMGNNDRWLDFANRLREANNGQGIAQTIKIRGDHQGMLTRPQSVAQGILQAASAPLVAS